MGRRLALILAAAIGLGVAGLCYALLQMGWLNGRPAGHASIAAGGAAFLTAGVLLLTLSLLYNSTLSRLGRALRECADKPDAPRMESSAWMAPVVREFNAALEIFHQHRARMDEMLNDLRVRQRIVDGERDQLRCVLHTLSDGVIVSDAFDEIVTLNRAAADILGRQVESEERVSVERVIGDRRLCQLIREMRESGVVDEPRTLEMDLQSNGQSSGYQVTVSCLPNRKGEPGAVVTILHDLTREREIAQMKSDFVSKASHELRTPLSSIRAYVEMLVDGEAADEASRREFYTIIQNETERLSRLIDNMLNISRIEAGIVQIEREPVDIRAMIRRAADSLSPQAAEKDISISVRAAPVDLTAEGDPDMLYQVVLNLVSNAVKYTPNGGRISVSADTDNLTRTVVVSVSDTGLGIPPDALPRLFEKFYRIENFKRVAKGTGLGLNLCKHIVETVHHGSIGVESKLGMGSKFWFSIPMRYAGAKAA